MPDTQPSNAAAIWALGVTQIIGYGTLYYSFSILAPAIAAEFDLAVEWVYGTMSLALLAGGAISPYAGSLADKHGAARVMALGSLGAALALMLCGSASSALAFLAGVILIELASAFVLYATAFALLAQATGPQAQRSITYLTLIAGFASTIFWPLTRFLLVSMTWHEVYFLFAALNLAICLPLHLWLTRFTRMAAARPANLAQPDVGPVADGATIFLLVVIGFSLAGFVSAAVLFHIVPMLGLLGLGSGSVLVAALFGPAQVASRLINMALGKDLPAPILAVISATMMPVALLVLVLTAPALPGAVAFGVRARNRALQHCLGHLAARPLRSGRLRQAPRLDQPRPPVPLRSGAIRPLGCARRHRASTIALAPRPRRHGVCRRLHRNLAPRQPGRQPWVGRPTDVAAAKQKARSRGPFKVCVTKAKPTGARSAGGRFRRIVPARP